MFYYLQNLSEHVLLPTEPVITCSITYRTYQNMFYYLKNLIGSLGNRTCSDRTCSITYITYQNMFYYLKNLLEHVLLPTEHIRTCSITYRTCQNMFYYLQNLSEHVLLTTEPIRTCSITYRTYQYKITAMFAFCYRCHQFNTLKHVVSKSLKLFISHVSLEPSYHCATLSKTTTILRLLMIHITSLIYGQR